MTSNEKIVEISIRDKFTLEVNDDENEAEKLVEILHNMAPEECKKILTQSYRVFDIEDLIIKNVVRRAIYNLNPLISYSQKKTALELYDDIFDKLCTRIKKEMNPDEIARVIAEEFNQFYKINLLTEDCLWAAKEIHHFIN